MFCHVKVAPIGLRHAIPSKSFQNKIINRGLENNRLVPIIDDTGSIQGCYAMVNTYNESRPQVKIISDKDKIDEFCKQNDRGQRKMLQERMGCKVKILENLGKQCRVCFEDGKIKKLDCQLLGIKDSEAFFTDPRFHYEMFPLQNRSNDTQFKLQTPLMMIGYEQYQIYGQLNNTITVSTTVFNKDIVKRQIFEKIEMLYELYDMQKKNLVMSIPSFLEIFKTNPSQKRQCYFQFRYIMRGRNFCNMDFSAFKNSIIKLKQVLEIKEEKIDKLKLIENSALDILTRQSSTAQKHKSYLLIATCFEMLTLDRFNQFQCNLNYESFIQKGLDNRFTKPIFFMIDFLLSKLNQQDYQAVLMQDLPQLLCQDRINIDGFLGISEQEEQENELDDEQVRKESCCIESQLLNPMLPILGEPEMKWKDLIDFANIFQIRDEIEQ